MPVVAAPADITSAEGLRSALLTAAASGRGTLVVDRMIPSFTTLPGTLTQPPTTTKGHSRQRTEGDARAEDQPVYAVARR